MSKLFTIKAVSIMLMVIMVFVVINALNTYVGSAKKPFFGFLK